MNEKPEQKRRQACGGSDCADARDGNIFSRDCGTHLAYLLGLFAFLELETVGRRFCNDADSFLNSAAWYEAREMNRLLHRFIRWKEWRKLTWMNPLQQVLVLLKIKTCTHFEQFNDWRYKDDQ